MGQKKVACVQILAHYEVLKFCSHYQGACAEQLGKLLCVYVAHVYMHSMSVTVSYFFLRKRRGEEKREKKGKGTKKRGGKGGRRRKTCHFSKLKGISYHLKWWTIFTMCFWHYWPMLFFVILIHLTRKTSNQHRACIGEIEIPISYNNCLVQLPVTFLSLKPAWLLKTSPIFCDSSSLLDLNDLGVESGPKVG